MEFKDYLRLQFTPRRVIALLVAFICFGICIAVVFGYLTLSLWQAVVVLFIGLLAYEWAG